MAVLGMPAAVLTVVTVRLPRPIPAPPGPRTKRPAPAGLISGVLLQAAALVGANLRLVQLPLLAPPLLTPATPIPVPVLLTAAGIHQTAVIANSIARSGAITTIPVI